MPHCSENKGAQCRNIMTVAGQAQQEFSATPRLVLSWIYSGSSCTARVQQRFWRNAPTANAQNEPCRKFASTCKKLDKADKGTGWKMKNQRNIDETLGHTNTEGVWLGRCAARIRMEIAARCAYRARDSPMIVPYHGYLLEVGRNRQSAADGWGGMATVQPPWESLPTRYIITSYTTTAGQTGTPPV